MSRSSVASHLNAVPSAVKRRYLYWIYLTDPRTGDEILGYVGKTINTDSRFTAADGGHITKNWGWLVTRIVPRVLPLGATADDLAVAEGEAIQHHGPPLNYAGNWCPVTGENRLDEGLCLAIAGAEVAAVEIAISEGRVVSSQLASGGYRFDVGGLSGWWRVGVLWRSRLWVLWRLVRVAVVVDAVVLVAVGLVFGVLSVVFGVGVPGWLVVWWQLLLVVLGVVVLLRGRRRR